VTDRLLTAEEVAARYQMKPQAIYRLAREGRLPVVRLGRYYRFRLDALARWELGELEGRDGRA
jgi:excisionase family DNA binding protein